MTLMSEQAFHLFLSVITGGVAALWAIHDIVLLARLPRLRGLRGPSGLRGAKRRDPLVADQRFGYGIGIVIGMIGVIGTLRFNGVL